MAVLTVPRGHNYVEKQQGRPLFIFGYPVPPNVYCMSNWHDMAAGGTWVGWTTHSGVSDKHFLPAEGTQDDILAMLVMMRMTG